MNQKNLASNLIESARASGQTLLSIWRAAAEAGVNLSMDAKLAELFRLIAGSIMCWLMSWLDLWLPEKVR